MRRKMLRHIRDASAALHTPDATSSDAPTSNAKIKFHLPKAAVFQRFAQQTGEKMAETYGDPRYVEQAVIDGLANFLKVVCELTVKRLKSASGK